MAFRGFNQQIEALRDPGIASILSASSNTLGSLLGDRASKRREATDLIQSLIGGGAGLLGKKMEVDAATRKRDLDMAANMALLGIGSGDTATSNIPMESTMPEAEGSTSPYQGQQLNPITNVEGVKNAPYQGGVQADVTRTMPSQSADPRAAKLAMISHLSPDKFLIAAEKLGYGIGGETKQELLNKYKAENEILNATKQAQIDKTLSGAETSQLEVRDKRITSAFSDPEFLNSNKDISGIEAQIDPASPRLKAAKLAFNNLQPAIKSEVLQKTSSAPLALNQFVENGLKVINLRNTNTIDRQRLKLIASGQLDQLGTLRPDEEAVLNFKDQSAPLVIQVAGADQSANSISNRDAESLARSLGDPTASLSVFKNNFAQFAAKGYLGAMRNAAVADATTYNELKSQLERYMGRPFDFDTDINNLPGVANSILGNLNKGQAVKSIKSPTSTPVRSQPASSGKSLNQRALELLGDDL